MNKLDYIIRAEEILDNPISFNQMKDMVYYIVRQIDINNKTIEKLKEKGKDVSSCEYERDYAKYILRLGNKPDIKGYKFWKDNIERKDNNYGI